MDVDVRALETYARLATRGADRAADALSRLTGIAVGVDATGVTLVAAGDRREAFAGREFVGVEVGLRGGLAGRTVVAFERAVAAELVSLLLPDGAADEVARSGLAEVAAVATSGFVDELADHLGVTIDATPPAYVEASGADVLPDGALDAERPAAFLVESRLSATDAPLACTVQVLPEYAGLADLLASDGGATSGEVVPVDRLAAFDRATARGAAFAAESVASLTGIETAVDGSRVRVVPVEDLVREAGDETVVAPAFELHGEPGGVLALLFDEASAATVAGSMLPARDDRRIGEPEREALCELGDVVTGGFVDGWADVLEAAVDRAPPEFVRDAGSAVMRPLTARLGCDREHAFVADSTLRTPDGGVRCDLYALADQRKLAAALGPSRSRGGRRRRR